MSKKREIISKSEMVAIKNSITNEMESAKVTMIVQRDKPKYKGEPFTMMFQAVSKVIAREITPATAKLLLYLISDVSYGNLVNKGIPQMAKDLGYSERQVHRAMAELEKLGVILKSKNEVDGRLTMYHINAIQSWKGTFGDREKKLKTQPTNQLDMFASEKPKAIKENGSFLEEKLD